MAGKKGMFDKLYPTPPGYMTIAQTAERLGRTRGMHLDSYQNG